MCLFRVFVKAEESGWYAKNWYEGYFWQIGAGTFKRSELSTTVDIENPRIYLTECITLTWWGGLIHQCHGNQEFTAPRSLVSQAGPSHWDVCSC
jgi:hypothetical protein